MTCANLRPNLALLLTLSITALQALPCAAATPPTVSEFRQAHATLASAARMVQGTFRLYQSDSVVPGALEDAAADLEVPLTSIGELWRSEDRFRVDYTRYRRDGETVQETRHAIAFERGRYFEYSSGLQPDTGQLRIREVGAPEAAERISGAQHRFHYFLDALWSKDGVAFANYLQRPDTELAANTQAVPDGFSLRVSPAGGQTRLQFEFAQTKGYPFAYGLLLHDEAGMQVQAERRASWTVKEGVTFPTRVAEVVSLSTGGGQTKVMLLNLELLKAGSPIEHSITPQSFQNFGGYQVYIINREGQETIAQRYQGGPASPPGRHALRRTFLWVNGLVIICIIGFIVYRIKRRRA